MNENVFLKYLKELLDIDSTMGECSEIADCVGKELAGMGYSSCRNRRGDVIASFGPGTSNSHGYERIHVDAIKETYALLMAYMMN